MQASRKRKIRGQSTLDGFLQLKADHHREDEVHLGQENQDPQVNAGSNGGSEAGDGKMMDYSTALKQVMEARVKGKESKSMLR